MSAKSRVRPVLAVVTSYVAWVLAFWVPIVVMTLFWPALRATVLVLALAWMVVSALVPRVVFALPLPEARRAG